MYSVLLVLNAAFFLFVLYIYMRKPYASAFHPATFYAAVHGFVFVIRPFFVYYGGYTSIYVLYEFSSTPSTRVLAILAAALAYGVLMFALMLWAPVSVPASAIPDAVRERLKRPILIVSAIISPVAIYGMLHGWNARAYDLSTMVTTANGYNVNTTSNGYLTDSQQMLVPIVLMIAWAFRFRLLSLVPFLVFVVLRAGTGGRGPFLIAIFAMGLLWLYESKRRWPSPRILLFFVAGLAFFSFVGADRGQAVRGLFISSQVELVRHDKEQHAYLDSMDFANLEYLEFIITTIPDKTNTYGYFLENLQIFTEPIPRAIWPGKPIGPPIQMYDLFNYGNPWGITVSIPGAGLAGLGWPGVVIWSLVFAYGLGAIYRYFARNIYSPFVVLGYINFLAATVLYFRDGALLTILRLELFLLTPLVLVYLASPVTRRQLALIRKLGGRGYQRLRGRPTPVRVATRRRPVRGPRPLAR